MKRSHEGHFALGVKPAVPVLVVAWLALVAAGSSAQVNALKDLVALAVESGEGTWFVAAEDGGNRAIDLGDGVRLEFVDYANLGVSGFSVGGADHEALRITLAPSSFKARRVAIRLAEPALIQGITKTMTLRLYAPEVVEAGLRIIILDSSGIEFKIAVAFLVSDRLVAYRLAIPPWIHQRIWGRPEWGLLFAGIEFVPRGPRSDPATMFLGSVSAIVDTFEPSADKDVPEDW